MEGGGKNWRKGNFGTSIGTVGGRSGTSSEGGIYQNGNTNKKKEERGGGLVNRV